jgi:hypothetical protein
MVIGILLSALTLIIFPETTTWLSPMMLSSASSTCREYNLPDLILRIRPTLFHAGRGSREDILSLITEVTGEKKKAVTG